MFTYFIQIRIKGRLILILDGNTNIRRLNRIVTIMF